MPKRVDHEARRRLIADALMRVAADRGLEAVSLRHVATEAGVSAGMVQHYFRTKDQMMLFALGVVGERVQARMADAGGVADPTSPTDLLRALLVQLLPLDDVRRHEGRVMLAFLSHSTVSAPVAAALRESAGQLRGFLAGQIGQAQAKGEAAADLDPAHTATALVALMDGLGIHVLAGHYTADTALAVFDDQMRVLFGRRPE